MERKGHTFWEFIISFFDFKQEKEDETTTIESISADVEFRGAKMWILICAILIASLGLNMNSTAVIIGAMLISPLMGPIIGFGLGLGITDFQLVKRSIRNLLMAVGISVITSTLYFVISPISLAQSELLARTQPTIYDVLIALFGGFAGIIAGTSKSKGQVIPGVAIATALMPPLCTAGYGLATWQLDFFFGAFYLFIINAVFIGLSTFVTIRALQYKRVTYVDERRGRRLNNLVVAIVLCTVVPSIILAYNFIQSTYNEVQQEKFVKEEMAYDNSFVLSYSSEKGDSVTLLNVNIIGEEIEEEEILRLKSIMPLYGLKKYDLKIRQGKDEQGMEELRYSILKDVQSKSENSYTKYLQLRSDSLMLALDRQNSFFQNAKSVADEITALFEEISNAQFGQMYSFRTDTAQVDTIQVITLTTSKEISAEREKLIRNWLSLRFKDPMITFSR